MHPTDWHDEPKMRTHSVVKTNAVRFLDRLGIKYELREYEVDPDDLSAGTVAAKIGIPPEQLFKTLAVKGDRNGIYLAVIPATGELDFKALAHQTGDRKVDMVPLKEVQAATGYIRGGVTALACKKNYPVYIDELAEICDVISVSAGMRGLQVLLAPEDYIRAVKAKVVAITKGKVNSDYYN
jgi:Cys-tRNA(Pro)/Cys-tRNA(Cys) deacylase